MPFIQLLFFFLIIIPSAIVHEYAHGFVADKLGDPTARLAGRLTLNPKAHIDLWGTIIMPIFLILVSGGTFMFAYAKPVPYNPYNLKNPKRDPGLVAVAGPMSNFLLALVFALIIKFSPTGLVGANFLSLLALVVYANILLLVFNLIPIPPLDGSKVLFALLPDSAWRFKQALERNGFIILLLFLFFGFQLIVPVVQFLYRLMLGL